MEGFVKVPKPSFASTLIQKGVEPTDESVRKLMNEEGGTFYQCREILRKEVANLEESSNPGTLSWKKFGINIK